MKKADRTNNGVDEKIEICSKHANETKLIREEIAALQTTYLTRVADKMLVQIPDMFDGSGVSAPWYYSEPKKDLVLDGEGRRILQKDIKKAQREHRLEWVQWVTALTGMIGAAIGLAAIFK